MRNELLNRAEQYVRKMYATYNANHLVFHNIEHTARVFNRCNEIAGHYELEQQDMLALFIAAWFHDTGHLLGGMKGHEDKSIEVMEVFMNEEQQHPDLIKKTRQCILATKMPHAPKSLVEEIICDADTYNLGTDEFKETNKAVKKEHKKRGELEPLKDWETNTLKLLQTHHYFTSYCKELLSAGKQKNIDRTLKKQQKAIAENNPEAEEVAEEPKNNKEKLITRGIQTMLRLTSENHLELSNMADGKANILISVNSIIISVILSILLRKLEADKHLAIPTIIFLSFSVITVVISILATRPKITGGRFTEHDVLNKKTNLLFFGNFHKSSLKDYQWAMQKMMRDKDYLYGSLVTDIHQLGVVLGRKYMLIRIAYNVFMVGIIVSVLAFGIAVALHNPGTTTIITTPATPPL